MEATLRERVEEVLDIHVRPYLRSHGGGARVTKIDDGTLHVELLGQCVGCPSAELSMSSYVAEEVKSRVPEITNVVQISGVSDSLINEAKRLLTLRVRSAA